ncbi:3066_t:CDS:2 [Dentiscutata erythropus]|uniref:3066_t:CDS:1 n=1 Tax=Dentiscutata erythropus TaxID=1348616 RepID=A0A9N9AA61_9GLOM|nr:3066_t:CDS:2 [Dentiscutata erythropus]
MIVIFDIAYQVHTIFPEEFRVFRGSTQVVLSDQNIILWLCMN